MTVLAIMPDLDCTKSAQSSKSSIGLTAAVAHVAEPVKALVNAASRPKLTVVDG